MPLKGDAQLAFHPIHTTDGKVHMNGNSCPDMFQYHVALDWLSLEEGLIDKNRHVFLGPQLGHRLRQSRGHVGFFRGDLLNCLRAPSSFSRRSNH